MPKFLRPPLASLVRPFLVTKVRDCKVNLIVGFIRFDYAIVCKFETVTSKNSQILHVGKI